MPRNIKKTQIYEKVEKILILIIFGFGFLVFGLAKAQSIPEFMITWKADSYTPSDYQGKILPSPGSAINLSLELINNKQLVNLSDYEIRWFINNKLQAKNWGLKNLTYKIDELEREDQNILIKIMNYQGKDLEKLITIPLVMPEVIIRPINIGLFKALPFFFNVTSPNQLSFNWLINNQAPDKDGEDPNLLKLSNIQEAPPDFPTNIVINIANTLNKLENAKGILNFKF